MLLRKRIPLSGLTLVLLAGAAGPAFAETGLYVGGTVGESLFNQSQSDADAAILDAFNENNVSFSGTSKLDKNDVAFGGLIGYRFLPVFAAEVAYVDLGKLNYRANGTATDGFFTAPATAGLIAKAKGPTVSGLGILPLSPYFDLYGRLGAFFSKVTLTANINLGGVEASDSQSANSTSVLAGVGAAWHMGNRVSLRAEYTRFANVGDKDTTGQINIDLFNVGLTYSFW